MLLGGLEITNLVCDSRLPCDGAAFFCLTGTNSDGHSYARKAYDKGARVFVCEHHVDLPDDAVQLTVPDSREAMSLLAAEFYGHPAKKMTLIGVTGTKGKSTIAALIYEALNRCGKKAALCGTNGIFIGSSYQSTPNTTPESLILQKAMADAVSIGTEYMVMEVSSQAYKMKRVFGLHFDIGIFTNLSRDHIGGVEHADYNEYRECKSMLFENSTLALLNADDKESSYMAAKAPGRILYYSAHKAPGVSYAEKIERFYDGQAAGSSFIFDGVPFTLRLPGDFNVENAAAVITCCRELGLNLSDVSDALSESYVKGRFEAVRCFNDRAFVIDYAHNGVSLRSALSLFRQYEPKRLIVLFGSVGGRTEERRSEMGKAAAEFADFTVITSDNPDFEDPSAIISDIEKELTGCPHICITDREEAIKYAVKNSLPGDIIIFAGKGHEDYQLICGNKVPFCERRIIEETAAEMSVKPTADISRISE